MDNKKVGIIGLVLVAIFIVFEIMDTNDALTFLPERFGLGNLLISLLIVGAGCWILSNDEHMIFAYADIVIAIMYIIYSIAVSFIPEETYTELAKVLAYIEYFVILVMIINLPLLVRTQSQAHRAVKYVTVLFIVLLVILSLTSKDSSAMNLYTSAMGMSYSKPGLIDYGLIIVEALLIANPMVALATADGLGGGKSKTPKLVARNQATDPNMAHESKIESNGINYGGMPVPDGVVANQNFNAIPNDNLDQYVSPEVGDATATPVTDPVAAPPAPEALEPAPVPQVDVAPVAEPAVPATPEVPTQPVAAPAAPPVNPVPEAVPTNTMNSDDVAAELQSLTNNNQ